MTISKDVSTVGSSRYERAELDFYPTPESVTKAILSHVPTKRIIWEPCCGNNAIANVLVEEGFTVLTSDVKYYGTQEPFFECNFLLDESPVGIQGRSNIVIVTNPPYDKSHEFVQRFFELEEVTQAFFLLRHEWDASQKSYPFVSSPWFKTKYVLKRRPRWIEGSKVAPRFPYAWYEWDKNNTKPCTTVYGVEPVVD